MAYSIGLCICEAVFRHKTIYIEVGQFHDSFDVVNKWACILLNSSFLIYNLFTTHIELALLHKSANYFNQMCEPNKMKTVLLAHIISMLGLMLLFNYLVTFYFLKFVTTKIGIYGKQGALNLIILTRYAYKLWLINLWQMVYLIWMSCLRSTATVAIEYKPSHPISDYELNNEAVTIHYFLGIFKYYGCNNNENQHLRYIPVAVTSLHPLKLVDYLRLELIKSVLEYSALIDLARVNLILFLLFETIPIIFDAFFVMTTIFFADYAYETMLEPIFLCIDRIYVIFVKVSFLCYMFYAGSLAESQVR